MTPGDNLVLENIPPIPQKIADDTARYGEFRSATLFDWNPIRREMLIGTRFGDTVQVHAVSMPGGARRQLTFFPDRVLSAQFLPDGNEFLFQKDTGGGEWFQIFRCNLATGAITLLTDGHSRNESYLLAHHATRLVYTSTQRNNKDSDPDRDSEFQRLARIDLASMQITYLTTSIGWDIDAMAASEDGKSIAFAANENGYSRLYLLDTASGRYRALPHIPAGVVTGLRFHLNNRDLGFSVSSARAPLDAYSIDVHTGKLDCWTTGETGGLNAADFVEPALVKWNSFDGLALSGFLYQPDAARFPGKRPVIVEIHGGPESQFRPVYQGRENYLINELGVAVLSPNVRGSSGYGKSFLKLDNGFHRDDTYKDIATLLDWIATQPQLDAERVMIFGGSYGGHMTWAVSAFYNERIRCAMPVVGMSNLVTFLEHTEAYRRDLRRVEYGDERDPAMRAYLEQIAPLNHLDAMHKPIFAVVGRNDPRVPWTESRQIIDKLEAQGTPTWFLVANDEGHGYAKKKNRDFMFDAEAAFIDDCLLNAVPGIDGTPGAN